MPGVRDIYSPPPELVLGKRMNVRVPVADQTRQRAEVEEILQRLRKQPGVILADEVGMGKTFVALGVAYSVAVQSPRGPVIVMAPANLIDKWEQDLKTFCELYLEDRRPLRRQDATQQDWTSPRCVRYAVARHSVDLMKLLDDKGHERRHVILLAQGAMARRQSDKWIRLALIAEALRRHGRGHATRLIQVKRHIHRFLAELLRAIGEEQVHDGGDELWRQLLKTDPEVWKDTFNNSVRNERWQLDDDPVPKSVLRAVPQIDLKLLAKALEQMPVRKSAHDSRTSERLSDVRKAVREVEAELWKQLLAKARWRSPLLVMDEAHHLKNPGTALARQLQSPDSEEDLRTGEGAMAKAFDRMLFLTATPFQLGHHELVHVLGRFRDIRWDTNELGDVDDFKRRMSALAESLNESQRSAIALQRSWSRLRLEDVSENVDDSWEELIHSPHETMNHQQRAVVEAFHTAKRGRDAAQAALRPWIVRHDKGATWVGTAIARRLRRDGAAVVGQDSSKGIPIPPNQLLPFFLAARSAINPRQDLLGEALCSSYEAFRHTRENRDVARDDEDELTATNVALSHSRWYLSEFDQAQKLFSGSNHPKINLTVRTVVDLWEAGEKVLVFAFYRRTCRALRRHISQEIELRIRATAQRRLRETGREVGSEAIDGLLERVQRRYFDDAESAGRRAVDAALKEVMLTRNPSLDVAQVLEGQPFDLTAIMRRFLRVATTLVRFFPLAEFETLQSEEAVARMIDHSDASGLSWRQKFDGFIEFLTERCSSDERNLYLEAAGRTQTGGIRVEGDQDEDANGESGNVMLANVQEATGKTRRDARARLMRAFNTPFFPDILVCSQVMGEGVDLQRFCRHVIHHDLAWNPSTIEQRTGRVDRLGCKAEGRQSIVVYLPFLAGTADERQYRVMSDREQWFRIVMGQDEVARLIAPDSANAIPLPPAISQELNFSLGLRFLSC